MNKPKIDGLMYTCHDCQNKWFSDKQVEYCPDCGSTILYYDLCFEKQ